MANDRRDPRYDYGGYKARGEIEAALSGVNTAADAFARAYGVATQIKDRRDAKKLAQAAAIPGMAALAAERYGSPSLAGYQSDGRSRRRSSGSAAGVYPPATAGEGAEAQWAAKLAARAAATEDLQRAEQEKEALQRAVGLLGAKLETPETVRRNELRGLESLGLRGVEDVVGAPPLSEVDIASLAGDFDPVGVALSDEALLSAAVSGRPGDVVGRDISPEYAARLRAARALEGSPVGGDPESVTWGEMTPEYEAIVRAARELSGQTPLPMPSGASRGLSPRPLDGAVEEITVREEQVELVASKPKPGEAADPRPDAPRGLLAQAEEALGKNRKNISALYKRLDELDSSSAGYINPFQKFGRDVGYTPSLRAVAEGVMRAENGDFRLINMVAGRSVGRHELSGLYAEYREFISGAEKKASEIGEERRKTALGEKATAASKQQQKQMGIITDELVRYGWKPEHAKAVAAGVVSSYSDPDDVAKYMERARKFTEAQQKRAADEAKARRKAKGSGTGGVRAGRGDQVLWARSEKLADNLRDAQKKLADARSFGNETDISLAVRSVAEADRQYRRAVQAWEVSAGIRGDTIDTTGDPGANAEKYDKQFDSEWLPILKTKGSDKEREEFFSVYETRLLGQGMDPKRVLAESARQRKRHELAKRDPTVSELEAEKEAADRAVSEATSPEGERAARERSRAAASAIPKTRHMEQGVAIADEVKSVSDAGTKALDKDKAGGLSREEAQALLDRVSSVIERLGSYQTRYGTGILSELLRPTTLAGDDESVMSRLGKLRFYEERLAKIVDR